MNVYSVCDYLTKPYILQTPALSHRFMYLFRFISLFSLTKCHYALASAQQKQKYMYIQLQFITDMIMKQIPTLNAKNPS